MGLPLKSGNQWDPNPGYNDGYPVPSRFRDHKRHDRIVVLFELEYWVSGGSGQLTSRHLDFVHNGSGNFLMLNGAVLNLKGDSEKDEKLPVWMKD